MARIIIVEDDLGQQEELQSFLVYAGHEVLAVSGSKELEQRLQFVPEIALLDYNLPGETGVEIALRLRKQYGTGIGIVMVTARSLGVDRVECRRAGADAVRPARPDGRGGVRARRRREPADPDRRTRR